MVIVTTHGTKKKHIFEVSQVKKQNKEKLGQWLGQDKNTD